MAEIDASSGGRISPSLWLRFISAALRIFASIIGVLDLASVAAHYGFEWHRLVQEAVENYRA